MSWSCTACLLAAPCHLIRTRVHRVLEYLEKDAKFLEEQGVMDYSLLLVGHTSTAHPPQVSAIHFCDGLPAPRACKRGGRQ